MCVSPYQHYLRLDTPVRRFITHGLFMNLHVNEYGSDIYIVMDLRTAPGQTSNTCVDCPVGTYSKRQDLPTVRHVSTDGPHL